jgi:hypothetical protein
MCSKKIVKEKLCMKALPMVPVQAPDGIVGIDLDIQFQ